MADERAEGDTPPTERPIYDQVFFLALAKGKDEWNKWRRDPANDDVRVTFAGIDFSEAPRDEIDFTGFEFGDQADFSGCKWRGGKAISIGEDPQTWRRGYAHFSSANFGLSTNFADANFGDRAEFGRAIFGDEASFDRATFGDTVSFSEATLGNRACFAKSFFGGWATFYDATFGNATSFESAAFEGQVIFEGAVFGERTNFGSAAFSGSASFNDASFGSFASFEYAAFGGVATFESAAFGTAVNFENAFFNGHVKFTGKAVEQWSKDFQASMDERNQKTQIALKERHEDSWRHFDSGPDRFLVISFANARFDLNADFSGRSFEQIADFTNARAYSPPDFTGASNIGRIDFTGAYFGSNFFRLTFDRRVVDRYRVLRKEAEERRDHDRERNLYIEERKAELGVSLAERARGIKKVSWRELPRRAVELFTPLPWIAAMFLYWVLSDYGRSFGRPAAWLVASGFFFYWGYSKILAPLAPKFCPLGDQYDHAIRMLALGNTVPFVGPLTIETKIKEFLFCSGNNCSGVIIPPEGYQMLVLTQNLFSITLVFFIGLALRNYFKIK